MDCAAPGARNVLQSRDRARRLVGAVHGVQIGGLRALWRGLYRLCDLHYRSPAEQRGFDSASITSFWAVLGLAAIAAAFAWGPILGRLRGGWGASATIGTVMIGAALPLLWRGPAAAYLSAILFGGSMLAVIAAVTSFARRAAKPHAWTSAIAALTIAFGIGQCIGPVLSGALSDGPSGIRAGLWVSVGILFVGTVIAAFQREPSSD